MKKIASIFTVLILFLVACTEGDSSKQNSESKTDTAQIKDSTASDPEKFSAPH
jgi:hypothetical protein